MSVAQSVKKVAVWLDRDKPYWPQILVDRYGENLIALFVSNADACVLTAIYGKYTAKPLRIHGRSNRTINEATACYRHEDDIFRALWLAEVKARLDDVN